MSWIQRLYETYEPATQLDLPQDKRIAPIRHTLQNAHINIVLNDKAEFVSAKVLKKFQVVLPATEASEARANVDAPHGLADKLQYVAKDYAHWGGAKKPYFESYFKQLQAWCKAGAPRKVEIVRNYVAQGTVLSDLIQKAKIFEAASANSILTVWPEGRGEAPEIFGSLPKEGGVIEPGSALVCWSVEMFDNFEKYTWKDSVIWQSWIDFQSNDEAHSEICMVTGQEEIIARLHPAKLRHSGDKAKLISANDTDGMTFRGRFIESGQAAAVGSNVTQKAHNALRWLIARQGIRSGDQVTVAWAISGKEVPQPMAEAMSYDDDEPVPHSEDLGLHVAQKINKKRLGYAQKLENTEQLSLISIDSATPGRMAVAYYREFLQKEYFDNLNAWYEQFAWYQRITKDLPKATNATDKTKPDKKTIWPWLPPSPEAIAHAAYGATLNEKLKKQVYAKILTCIAEGDLFPSAFVEAALNRACSPMGYEVWEWERNVGVACALYKGFTARRPPDKQLIRSYSMALDTECRSRDYLYGRLLAVAERIEGLALNMAGENRRTTAERYMQQFAARPYQTWLNIELALEPYKARLNNSRAGFLTNREKELTDIQNLFDRAEFCSDTKLSGEFLLGYHCQKMTYRKSKAASQDEPTSNKETNSTSNDSTSQE